MIINSIELENIRSYKHAKLDFQEGSTLLSGDIGSGKTTVLLAIEFALFGLQPGQKGISLLRNGADSGRVLLKFSIDDKEVVIERELKRNKSVSQDKVFISINNAKREVSIKELKNEVLRILNYPSEFEKKTNLLFKFTVYTPQEEMKQIILERPDTRLDTLRHVFGMDKYKKIQQNINIILRKIREEIREKQGLIADLENKQNLKTEKSTSLDNTKKELQNIIIELQEVSNQKQEKQFLLKEIEEKIQQKQKIQKEIEKSKLLFGSKREYLLTLNKEIKSLEQEKIVFEESKLEAFKKKKTNLQESINSLQEKYNKILGNINYLNTKQTENISLRERMSNMEKCPTCLQEVNPEYRINISNKIAKELKEIEENKKQDDKEKESLNNEITNLNSELKETNNKIQEQEILKIKSENYQKNLLLKEQKLKEKHQTEKDIKMLEDQISLLEKSSIDLHKINEDYEKKEKQFSIVQDKEKNFEIKKGQHEKEIEMIEIQIKEIIKEIDEKTKEKQKLEKMNELRDWLSEKFLPLILFVEKNMMLKLREEFSRIFNKWFLMLVSDEIEARLDENFTPLIEQRGYDIDYAFLSGGERTAIALAYRLALNQVINSLLSRIKTRDLVILDEPTDGFSEQQVDKMRDIFQELDVKQLILVSHEVKIESFVDHIMKVKKDAGISRIE